MMVRLIDGDTCDFVSADEFESKLTIQSSDETKLGSSYVVVAILGGQCSGKSTLLNAVFGSEFKELPVQKYGDSDKKEASSDLGQIQTTRGTWASLLKCHTLKDLDKEPFYFLLDNEGCDGRERFDDTLFERRSALFSLVLSDVLIMNMWTTEVGRFAAANLALLRSIFEVHAQLFGFSRGEQSLFRRPVLFFVLRDHTSGTLAQHTKNIKESLKQVWKGVCTIHSEDSQDSNTGPDTTVDEVFDIRVFSFPHYVLQRESFDKKVLDFRSVLSFISVNNVFSGAEHEAEATDEKIITKGRQLEKTHSLSKIYQRMYHCWECIMRCKDLDLPTQTHLAAEFRCEEIRRSHILPQIERKRREWQHSVAEGNLLHDIENMIEVECTRSVEEFRKLVSHYPESVTRKFITDLRESLPEDMKRDLLLPMADLLTRDVTVEIREKVKGIVSITMRHPVDAWAALCARVKEMKKDLVDDFLRTQVVNKYISADTLRAPTKAEDQTLYALVESKLHVTVSHEIRRQLALLNRIDTAPKTMIELFSERYIQKLKDEQQEKYSHRSHQSSDTEQPSSRSLVTVAESLVHTGVDYLNNILCDRYENGNLTEAGACIKYTLKFDTSVLDQGAPEDQSQVSIDLARLWIEEGTTRKRLQDSTEEHRKVKADSVVPKKVIFPPFASRESEVFETESSALLTHCNVIISDPSAIEQTLRLYFQGVSHAVELQYQREMSEWQQSKLKDNEKSTFAFAKEVPLWFWWIVLFFAIDDIFQLLTSSYFWIAIFAGSYFYLNPLSPLRVIRSIPFFQSFKSSKAG